jgi:hypothetical protein
MEQVLLNPDARTAEQLEATARQAVETEAPWNE